MPYPTFDRSRLQIQALARRGHDMDLSECLGLEDGVPPFESEEIKAVADRITHAHRSGRHCVPARGVGRTAGDSLRGDLQLRRRGQRHGPAGGGSGRREGER